jgi:hypothetical protein
MSKVIWKRVKPHDMDACDACGHDGGFHVVLRFGQVGRRTDELAMLLKCPSCKQEYDVGLNADVSSAWD